MKTKLYKIKTGFAKMQNLPLYFDGIILKETTKAVYMYGRGTTETTRVNMCCVCGRALTHPVSVELGIGPICGGHHWDWNLVGGFSLENLARLKQAIQEKVLIDSWIPKSVIIDEDETTQVIEPPKDHKMLSVKKEEENKNKTAVFVKYQNTGILAVKITFPYNIEDLIKVKSLSGRRFHNESTKYWSAPLCLETVEKLKEWNFQLDKHLLKYIDHMKQNVKDMKDIDVPELKGELYAFQKKGVSFIEAKNGRALIADQMGLGKTIQALAWMQLHKELRPAVIVCPASLKINWRKEAEMWLSNPSIQILSGTNPTVPIIGDVIIINYDILNYWLDVLLAIKPQIVITDECHYYKNAKANRTKAVKKLGKNVPHFIALSGTPITNRPEEILNAIQLIDPTVFPSPWKFLQRYCGAKHNGYGWDFSGASNTEELYMKLSNTIMIRRKKQDVLKDLPDKIKSFISIDIDNEKEYNDARDNFIDYIHKTKGREAAQRASNASILAEIEGLKQLSVKGKMKQAIEWISDFLETGEKLVIFAVHKSTINTLMDSFHKVAVKIDGSVSAVNRDKAVTEFQSNPDVKLFIGNIKAAGVGLTLTAASNVAFLELPWTPGDLDQAEDRCHRIGQDNAVNVYYLLAFNTIEEDIAELLDKKRKVLDKVLDGIETDESSLLSELIYYLKPTT